MANRDKIITKFNSRQKTNRRLDGRPGEKQKKHDKKRWRARREKKFAILEDD